MIASRREWRLRGVLSGMLVLGVTSLLPGAALAAESPLLSGYGGPGAGEQQVIGSTLVAGGTQAAGQSRAPLAQPEGRAPGAATSPVETTTSAATTTTSTRASTTNAGGATHRGRREAGAGAPAGGGGKGSAGGSGPSRSSARGSGVSTGPVRVSPARERLVASDALGLSGTQWLEVVLVAVALLLVALGTWRLAPRSAEPAHDLLDDGLGSPDR